MVKTFYYKMHFIFLLLIFSLQVEVFSNEKLLSSTSRLKEIEAATDGRIGVFAINTKTGHVLSHRSGEIFPTGCTSKTIGVGAVLKASMKNPELLSKVVDYTKNDLDSGGYHPVTERNLGQGMKVHELCSASISYSDNTAMNLLLQFIDRLDGMNQFARSIGNTSFSQNNDWPKEAYSGGKGNVFDAASPKDMVESLQLLTAGDVLENPQRDLFNAWMISTKTGTARIRSSIPNNWIVGNKTGTGGAYGTTNDLAVVWPPNHEPLFIGVYYTSDLKEAKTREDVIAEATKVIVEDFITNDPSLN